MLSSLLYYFDLVSSSILSLSSLALSSVSPNLLLNPTNVFSSLVAVLFSSMTSVWNFKIFSNLFDKVLTVFIHSSSEFREHFYDYHFELFIRLITYLYFIKFFFFCSFILFIWNMLLCFFTLLDFLSVSMHLMKQLPLPVLQGWPCTGDKPYHSALPWYS